MKLRSTTWRQRNRPYLQELGEAIGQYGMSPRLVYEVGAGAVTPAGSALLPTGPRADMTFPTRLVRLPARVADDFRRKHGLYSALVSPEVGEVEQTLAGSHYGSLVVLDNDDRVLSAVKSEHPNVFVLRWDMVQSPTIEPADVIVCHNVVQVTEDPQRCLENIARSVRAGGLLSVSAGEYPIDLPERLGFAKIGDALYRRAA